GQCGVTTKLLRPSKSVGCGQYRHRVLRSKVILRLRRQFGIVSQIDVVAQPVLTCPVDETLDQRPVVGKEEHVDDCEAAVIVLCDPRVLEEPLQVDLTVVVSEPE